MFVVFFFLSVTVFIAPWNTELVKSFLYRYVTEGKVIL